MTKKILIVAVALMATTLLATNSFAQTCTGTPVLQFVATGSSAQFNTFAYAAVNLVSGGSFNTSAYNLSSSKSAELADTRFTVTNLVDTGNNMWVVWDNNTNCNVYAYISTDSTVGNKDFFAYKEVTVGTKVYSVAAEYPPTSGALGTFGAGKVSGLPDTTSSLPLNVNTALTTPPVPNSTTDTPHRHGLDYCGYAGTAGSSGAGVWCYFNAGMTDIRPEDALYATTRALSSIPSAGGLTGLGYNNPNCLAGTEGAPTANQQGCPVADSFGQGKLFNVVTFGLTKDPITEATPPKYQTLQTGAAPVVVFVSNNDTSGNPLAFSSTYTDSSSNSHYTFTDINRAVLAKVFDSTITCTGDLLPGTPAAGNNVYDNGFTAGPPPGGGLPIQVVVREPLSGTYNTFEFTAVRTLGASSNGLTAKPTSTAWVSDADSGQEFSASKVTGAPEGTVYANDPGFSFGTGGCPTGVTLTSGTAFPPTGACGDPLFMVTGAAGTACGNGLKLRAVTTGVEVKAASGQINNGASKVVDGIGYSFWSYGNFGASNDAVGGTCTASASTGLYTCTVQNAHYLTVDAVDPLFATEGGELDNNYYSGTVYLNGTAKAVSASNPSGAFNLPQCGFHFFTKDNNGNNESCFKIPFTHVYDGKYPLWSLLRLVTMTAVGSGATQTLAIPSGVINLVASAEAEAADQDSSGVKKNLSDFVPLLALTASQTWSVTSPYGYPGANTYFAGSQHTALPTGTLTLGVFRSHFKNTNNGLNGHYSGTVAAGTVCNFANPISIGLTSLTGCLNDAGGDVGGSILPVQADLDFFTDFGASTGGGDTAGNPNELYNLHQ
jgi:hypothetical protein